MPAFVPTQAGIVDVSYALSVNLPLYVQCITSLISQPCYELLGGLVNIMDILLAIIFLAVLGISVIRANKSARYLYILFLGSAIVILLGFIFSSLTEGLWSSRFLIFTALSVFAVISLTYDEKNWTDKLNLLLLALVVVLVLSTVPLSYSKLSSQYGHPNQEEYGLIAFVESKGYDFGYSDYGNANVITYLSKEGLIVRAVSIQGNTINACPWLASEKWYDQQSPRFFYLSKTGTAFNSAMQIMTARHPPQQVDSCEEYNIYYYDTTKDTS